MLRTIQHNDTLRTVCFDDEGVCLKNLGVERRSSGSVQDGGNSDE